METLAITVIVAAAVLIVWRDHVRQRASDRRRLDERLRSQEERLRIIDTELRKVHGVLIELLKPDMPPFTPKHDEQMKALDALHTAGWMASGLHCWPHQPPQ